MSRGSNVDIEGIKDIILNKVLILCFPIFETKSYKAIFKSLKVDGSSLSNETKRELLFNLPTGQAKNFPELFESLEKDKAKLGFLNLGLTATTMEDVFLR